jgi:hypothetical protein
MKTSIIFSKPTNTFRLMPQNYWLASIKDNKLLFDSWDGMTKEILKKNPIIKIKVFFLYFKNRFFIMNKTIN